MNVRKWAVLLGSVAGMALIACAHVATLVPTATPTYDLTCPNLASDVTFATLLSDADAVRLAVLSGCSTAPGRDVRLQASKATIASTTWRAFRQTLGETSMDYPNDDPLAVVTLTGMKGYDYYKVVINRRTADLFATMLYLAPPPAVSDAEPTPATTPTLSEWLLPTATSTPTPTSFPYEVPPTQLAPFAPFGRPCSVSPPSTPTPRSDGIPNFPQPIREFDVMTVGVLDGSVRVLFSALFGMRSASLDGRSPDRLDSEHPVYVTVWEGISVGKHTLRFCDYAQCAEWPVECK